MAEKRLNPLLIGGVLLAVTCLSLVLCSEEQSSYEPMNQVPGYDPNAKREDGDTQTDTIKALQAYAREAVKKADALHDDTQEKMKQVLENQHKVSSLERDNQTAKQKQSVAHTCHWHWQNLHFVSDCVEAVQEQMDQAKGWQAPTTHIVPCRQKHTR